MTADIFLLVFVYVAVGTVVTALFLAVLDHSGPKDFVDYLITLLFIFVWPAVAVLVLVPHAAYGLARLIKKQR